MVASLGKIVVASAGTPVKISATTLNVNAVYFSTLSGQSGQQVYVGVSGMSKSTLVGVLKILQKPIASPSQPTLDSWTLQANVAMAPIDLSTIFLDADTSNDGLLVSYLIS